MKKMKYKSMEVRGYKFTSEDQLFLDTNIWVYMYGVQEPRDHWVKIYSTVFERILKAKSRIYIDVLVISEFINVYSRQMWKLVARDINQFKKFRNSPRFKQVAQDVTIAAKQVMSHCSWIEGAFTKLIIDNLLDDYAVGNSDFNDQVITEICKSNGLTLITNDRDFRSQEIQILTAYP